MIDLLTEHDFYEYMDKDKSNLCPIDLNFVDTDVPRNPFHYVNTDFDEESNKCKGISTYNPIIDNESVWEYIHKLLITPIDYSAIQETPEYHLNSPLAIISDADNLIRATYKCMEGVDWKASVQKFYHSLLINLARLQKKIDMSLTVPYKYDAPYEFQLNERGHIRDIKAQTIRDRVMQASLNYNVLLPKLLPKLIYDNGASQKGKGLAFARSRFENQLRNAYAEWGPDAIVFIIDFSKYFDNIRHNIALGMMEPFLTLEIYQFMVDLFRQFEVDVSYMSDEQYASCMDILFNSLDYADNISRDQRTGEKFMPKSVGIGSQTSQITGIFYPHDIDNYCKIVRGVKYYTRYMDDTVFIVRTKEEALDIFYNGIVPICNKLGIFINQNKTHYCPLGNIGGISFLKTTYFFRPEDGRLIRKVNTSVFDREYRRITKFKHLYDEGIMTLEDIINCFKGWLGGYKKFDSGINILKTENYFLQTFNIPSDLIHKNGRLKSIGNDIYEKYRDDKGKWQLRKAS